MAEAGVDIGGGSRTTAPHRPRQDHGPSPSPTRAAAEDGRPCDLVTVPSRQGLEAVDILRLRDGVGPVLHDGEGDTLGFLVPPGTADRWDVPGSACTQTYGRGPHPAVGMPPVKGTGWLVAPDAAYAWATDPAVLRAALGEAARTIEAVDRCR
ncbi:hypothetical protein J1792_01595 [Streptomyces triculaminicus]|uniref:Uncharacterized protein n=2 Tax=Streptomyces TaxID=1883 RepID=A0A939FJ46_9ACTN|nr:MULTISPECIES: hypothetical protein [Streptomyces]MBO0651543.1 hypothetical protein [Streptomyces triculaminicus]QSY47481.1 hypothetical protein J3S04_19440 [Streptomyces griseocarneus]